MEKWKIVNFQNMFFPSNTWQYSDATDILCLDLVASTAQHVETTCPKKQIKVKRYKPLEGSKISKVLISIM